MDKTAARNAKWLRPSAVVNSTCTSDFAESIKQYEELAGVAGKPLRLCREHRVDLSGAAVRKQPLELCAFEANSAHAHVQVHLVNR